MWTTGFTYNWEEMEVAAQYIAGWERQGVITTFALVMMTALVSFVQELVKFMCT